MLWCCGARHASRRSGVGWRVLESEADIQSWKSAAWQRWIQRLVVLSLSLHWLPVHCKYSTSKPRRGLYKGHSSIAFHNMAHIIIGEGVAVGQRSTTPAAKFNNTACEPSESLCRSATRCTHGSHCTALTNCLPGT